MGPEISFVVGDTIAKGDIVQKDIGHLDIPVLPDRRPDLGFHTQVVAVVSGGLVGPMQPNRDQAGLRVEFDVAYTNARSIQGVIQPGSVFKICSKQLLQSGRNVFGNITSRQRIWNSLPDMVPR